MRYAYPCIVAPEGSGFKAAFPDLPEALTGADTLAETLEFAADALATALAGHVHDRLDIPAPSPAAKGTHLVAVPPLLAAKLALYRAMRTQGITKVALGARLGVTEAAVRKLADPDHRSHIGQIEAALKALGRMLVVEDKAV
jgi:antitoxin HicB